MWSLPVDRAGLVGSDGETHQGIFDLSFLSTIPNLCIMAPKNKWELSDMMKFAVNYDGPIAIRYPRGEAYDGLQEFRAPIVYGKSEVIYDEEDIVLLAVGSMVKTAETVRHELRERGFSCTLVNARFVKPVDKDLILTLSRDHRLFVTMEENVKYGGFGEHVLDYLNEIGSEASVLNISLPDDYIEHGNVRGPEGRNRYQCLDHSEESNSGSPGTEPGEMSAGEGKRNERTFGCAAGAAGLCFIKRESEGHYHGRSGLCGRAEGRQSRKYV